METGLNRMQVSITGNTSEECAAVHQTLDTLLIRNDNNLIHYNFDLSEVSDSVTSDISLYFKYKIYIM